MDIDIHGIVGIRLVDPSENDAAVVIKHLGQFQKSLERKPDIIINVKDKLNIPKLTYLGLDNAGFTDDDFYIFSKKGNAKMRIPFEAIGDGPEIVIESGFYEIPWLFEIINLTFLKKKYIPMHATAFVYNDVGFLISGWTKGGKTEALLSFANHGAHYVGDEWVIISNDGKEMYGIPVPICIWEWQFEHIPKLLPKFGMERKILFKGIHFLDYVHKGLKSIGLEKSFPSMILNKAIPVFNTQLNVRLSPEKIFNGNQVESSKIDKIILSFSHNDSQFHLERCDSNEIAKRIFASNSFEQIPFLEFYKTFKFAFPNRRNEFLENIDEYQFSLLHAALETKETYKVFHPYPFKFEDFFNQLKVLSK